MNCKIYLYNFFFFQIKKGKILTLFLFLMSQKLSSVTKPTFLNDLPHIPNDCLLPKFEPPILSNEFSYDSSLYTNTLTHFLNDPLLGIPIDFCDLSKFRTSNKQNDLNLSDLQLVSSQNPSLQSVSSIIDVPKKIKSVENKPQMESQFKKSPFYEDINDPEIQEQLNIAFKGEVPEGEVFLLQNSELTEVIKCDIRGSECLEEENIHFITKPLNNQQYIKVVSKDGGDIKRSYKIYEDSNSYVYLTNDEEGNYILGNLSEIYSLKPMVPKDTLDNDYTGRPIVFEQ